MNFKSIKISKQIELAIRWLIYLAQTDKLKFVSLRSFCDQTKTSFYYLQKINRTLIKNNFVESKIGKNGGYRLKNNPKNISLLSVIEALEGPLALINCSSHCNTSRCTLKNCWISLAEDITLKLSQIKISQFV